jgi:hypothetical protein
VAASQRVDLVLERGERVQGDLLSLEGAPIGAAVIEVLADGDEALPLATARTGRDGRWAVNLARAGRVRVRARHPGIEPVEVTHVDASAGAVHLSARATGKWTQPKASVRGRLLWPDGKPAAQVNVQQHKGDFDREAITDDAGRFHLEGLLPGEVRLRYTAKGHATVVSARCALEPGSTRDLGDVTLPREEGWIQVRCEPPWPGLLAMVYDDGDARFATLWEDTQYRSPPLVPGEYRIRVQGFGIATMILPATVRAGTDAVVEVRPAPGYEQPFEISARSGWGSDSVRVEITTAGEPPIVTTLIPEPGRALSYAEFLRLGAHTVRVQSGSEIQEASFTVALGAREVVRVVLP